VPPRASVHGDVVSRRQPSGTWRTVRPLAAAERHGRPTPTAAASAGRMAGKAECRRRSAWRSELGGALRGRAAAARGARHRQPSWGYGGACDEEERLLPRHQAPAPAPTARVVVHPRHRPERALQVWAGHAVVAATHCTCDAPNAAVAVACDQAGVANLSAWWATTAGQPLSPASPPPPPRSPHRRRPCRRARPRGWPSPRPPRCTAPCRRRARRGRPAGPSPSGSPCPPSARPARTPPAADAGGGPRAHTPLRAAAPTGQRRGARRVAPTAGRGWRARRGGGGGGRDARAPVGCGPAAATAGRRSGRRRFHAPAWVGAGEATPPPRRRRGRGRRRATVADDVGGASRHTPRPTRCSLTRDTNSC